MRDRAPRPLTLEEAHAFLDSRPGWMTLCTVGRDGFPHAVPLGYFRVGDDIYLGCMAASQKVRNVQRDPHVSLLVERTHGSHLTGLMIQGEASVILADDERLAIQRVAARQRGVAADELPQRARSGGAFIQVCPRRLISWDYA